MTELVQTVGQREAQRLRLRVAAHKMADRGVALEDIAGVLKVHVRTVNRYLAMPRPAEYELAFPTRPSDLVVLQRDGLCRNYPQIDWFTDSKAEQEDAKAVCARCPVLQLCRQYGVSDEGPEWGVWGGLTREARQQELARRRGAERERRRQAKRGVA